jgi:tetratricopeptide (TPR) repeat protein
MLERGAILLPGAVALVVAGMLLASTEGAAQDRAKKPETKRVQTVGEWAFKRLSAAHEALAEEKYGEALAALDEMKGASRLNDYEKALLWQTYGYIYASQGKYPQAIDAFEKCLSAGGLPEDVLHNTQYNLAQLYVAQERFDDAVRVFQEWFSKAENPSAAAHYAYAVALYQKGDKGLALPQTELALQKVSKPPESWLQLALSLYYENKEYQKVIGVLETLVSLFPKKTYWLQLSAAYSQVDDHRMALAVLAFAHTQGMLSEERELTQLVQLYLYNDIPYEAGRVLEESLGAGKLQDTPDNWRLLSEAWVNARERGKARKPLEQAAAGAATGELYLQLAQIQIEREEWSAARESLNHAIQKGKLADPGGAQLLLGVASVSDEHWEQARAAFQAAAKYDKNRRSAEAWLTQIEAEIASDGAAPPDHPRGAPNGQNSPAASSIGQ